MKRAIFGYVYDTATATHVGLGLYQTPEGRFFILQGGGMRAGCGRDALRMRARCGEITPRERLDIEAHHLLRCVAQALEQRGPDLRGPEGSMRSMEDR